MSRKKNTLIRLGLTMTSVALGMAAITYNGVFAWFCFLPFFIAMDGLKARQAAKYAAIAGLILGGLSSFGLIRYGIGIIIALAIYAMFFGIVFGLATGLAGQKGFRGFWLLFLPMVWVALEFARTLGPISVPSSIAISQYRNLGLIQLASITGTYGISFIIVLVNCLFYRIIKTRRVSFMIAIATIFLLLYASSDLLPEGETHPGKNGVKVAIVQAGIPIERYRAVNKDGDSKSIIRETYFRLTEEVKGAGADLIVWPEGALAEYAMQEKRLRGRLEAIPRQNQAFFAAGMPSTSRRGAYNSVYVFSPSGKVLGQYDKAHLIPYFEEYKPGRRSPVINTALGRLGIAICFESLYPAIARNLVKKDAEILFILTNDAGFGRSRLVEFHARQAIFRAVETGRYVARAAQSGISMFIDPMGRVLNKTKEFERTILTGTVEPLSSTTFYSRYGDIFAYLCIAGCAALLFLKRKS